MTKRLFQTALLTLAIGLIAAISFAQTKPTVPITPTNADFINGLVRCYLNYEGTGTNVNDFAVGGIDGTMSAGAAWASDAEGNFIRFDPADTGSDNVDCGETGLDAISSEMTLMIRFSTNTTNQGRNVVSRSVTTGTTNSSDWRAFLQGSADRCDLCIDTSGDADACFGSTVAMGMTLGTVYTWAGTYSDTDDSVKLYLNGVQKVLGKAATGGTIISTSGRKMFQARFGAAKTADVDIYWVGLWSRRLTYAEIQNFGANFYTYFRAISGGRKRQMVTQ